MQSLEAAWFFSHGSTVHLYEHQGKSLKMTPSQIGRHHRYRHAFERMDEALQQGWLLEAITLEESIISDRLISCLEVFQADNIQRNNFSRLIDQTKKYLRLSKLNIEAGLTLLSDLDTWRENRNKCLHAMCKEDDHSYSENAVVAFEEMLLQTAKSGRKLVELTRDFSKYIKNNFHAGGS